MGDGLLRTAEDFRRGHAEVLQAIDDLTADLDATALDRETGCPGWSVRDVVAHVTAIESLLLGRPPPDHTVAEGLAHVRTPVGAFMEVGVDARRGWPVARLRREYREVATARLQALAALRDDELETESPGILGTSKLRNQLRVRVFDMWSHEQDIRRAVGRRSCFDGVRDAHGREMLLRGIANRVGQTIATADGCSIAVDIQGEGGAARAIVVSAGRGRVVEKLSGEPTVSLRLGFDTLIVLGCGRHDDPGARDRVEVSGDQALAAALLDVIAITP